MNPLSYRPSSRSTFVLGHAPARGLPRAVPRRARALAVVAIAIALAAPMGRAFAAPAPAEGAPLEEPRPFNRGSMTFGLALGLSSGQGTAVTLGGAFGYHVLAGLEPGLAVDVTFGSDRPTLTSLLPYLRWVIYRSYSVSPFLKVQGGRWFISGQDDLSVIGGGGGLVMFLSRNVGITLEGLVYRLFPSSVCEDHCTTTSIGLSAGFFFGGAAAKAPPPPAPMPASTAPDAPASQPAAVPEAHPQGDEPGVDPGKPSPMRE